MSIKELTKRYLLFVVSLFVAGLGVAVTKSGQLGVSPISSVPNVISIKFTVLTMGNWLIIWNCLLLVGQILLLRKDFKWINLLQVPLSFLFGYFTDFGMWIMSHVTAVNYAGQLIMVVCGTVILGLGVSLAFIANVIMNSGEAFVKAIADKTKKQPGDVKIVFDISCVVLSILISLILFVGKIEGAREGTLFAAVFTGIMVKVFNKRLAKPLNKILSK